MPSIQQLPSSVVNKIAAGEVIERPASLVKELLENAVDAGATRIDVAIERGGTGLVRVADNGCGIPAEELELAVASHATSKLQDADDLFRVRTLGFRGEALASIAAVSRLTLRSRPVAASGGAELIVVGGQFRPVVPCGCAVGTTLEVRQLFFNTPVRGKFLRSMQTEMGHVTEAFTRLALAYPQLHFTLRHNDREVYDLPASPNALDRIACFFGRDLVDHLIWLDSRDGDVCLSGYVGHPSQSRPNPRMQYLFLNGRSIRDRSLSHALAEAYRGLLLTGRSPIAFLSICMPPEMVDVNVHPSKLEVRFQDSGRLYSQLLGTLRTRFLTTDLTHRLQPVAHDEDAAAHDPAQTSRLRDELVEWAKGQTAQWDGPPAPLSQDVCTAVDSESPLQSAADFQLWSDVDQRQGRFQMEPPQPSRPPLEINRLIGREPAAPPPHLPPSALRPPSSVLPPPPQPARYATVAALQIHNCYLVAETQEGVIVIDQHALHERVLYEQLRATALAGPLESQNLLVPETLDLPPAEAAAALAHRDLLAQLGTRIEPFGGDTLLVTSYPAMLARVRPSDVLRGLVEHLVAGDRPPERRDLLDKLLHMIACKAAVKAGDRLTNDEIAALIEQRHLAQDAHHCPHGRPTALIFTREDLDKQFKRV